jgi:FHA domain-containing protein/fibronectin type III domain protein
MWIRIESGQHSGAIVEVRNGLLIGRDETCDVVVPDERVSRRHAYLSVDDQGHVILRDLSSSGTFVGGRKVEGGVPLLGNERMQLGDTVISTWASDPSLGLPGETPTLAGAPGPFPVGPPTLPPPMVIPSPAMAQPSAHGPMVGTAPAPPSYPAPIVPPPPPSTPPPAKRSFLDRYRWPLVGTAAGLVVIVALVVILATGKTGPTAGGGESPSAGPTGPPVAAPTINRATADRVTVSLSWTQPTGGGIVRSYNVYRDGAQIATGLSATSYQDMGLGPGKSYTYRIEAQGARSDIASSTIVVPVPALPLTAARVGGGYTMHFKVNSSYGYSQSLSGKTHTESWTLKPKCETGPCTITWRDPYYAHVSSTLRRSGATYKGTARGYRGVLTCQSGEHHATSTVTIELHVAKARVVDADWRATKIVGTFIRATPAQSGCTASGDTDQIIGTRFA